MLDLFRGPAFAFDALFELLVGVPHEPEACDGKCQRQRDFDEEVVTERKSWNDEDAAAEDAAEQGEAGELVRREVGEALHGGIIGGFWAFLEGI